VKEVGKFFQTKEGRYVILAIVGLVVLFIVQKSLKGLLTGDGPQQGTEELDIDENNLSYEPEQYDIWADALYEAFNYTGTNYGAVEDVITQLQTNDDLRALINAYGTRTLYVFGIPTASTNLPQAMIRELNWPYSVDDVNEDLTEQGITIQF